MSLHSKNIYEDWCKCCNAICISECTMNHLSSNTCDGIASMQSSVEKIQWRIDHNLMSLKRTRRVQERKIFLWRYLNTYFSPSTSSLSPTKASVREVQSLRNSSGPWYGGTLIEARLELSHREEMNWTLQGKWEDIIWFRHRTGNRDKLLINPLQLNNFISRQI